MRDTVRRGWVALIVPCFAGCAETASTTPQDAAAEVAVEAPDDAPLVDVAPPRDARDGGGGRRVDPLLSYDVPDPEDASAGKPADAGVDEGSLGPDAPRVEVVSVRSDEHPTRPGRARVEVRDTRVRPVAPLSGSVVGSSFPTLQWTTVADTHVTVELCRDRAMRVGCRPTQRSRDASLRVDGEALAPGWWFWRVRGDGGEAPVWQFRVPQGARGGAFDTSWGVGTDFNGDGRGELVYRLQGVSVGDALSVHDGTSTLPPSRARAILVTEHLPDTFVRTAQRVGDVDGDGFDDVGAVVSDREAPRRLRVVVLHGGPGGLHDPEVVRDAAPSEGEVFVRPAGDLNHDGYGDVLFKTDIGTKLLAGGPRPLRRALEPHVGGGPALTFHQGAADFDGDGLHDLIVWAAPGAWHVAYGAPDGSLRLASSPLDEAARGRWSPFAAAVGDVDGDGRTDVATGFNEAGYHGSGTEVQLLRGGAEGGVREVLVPARYERALEDVLDLGDLDGDGRDEVFTSGRGSYGGTLYPVIAWGGSAGAEVALARPWRVALTWVGDFDGDGVADFPFAEAREYRGPQALSVHHGALGMRTTERVTDLGEVIPPGLAVTVVR